MNTWTIATFVTKNTSYESVYEQYLKRSVNMLAKKHPQLRSRCIEVHNLGSWNQNVAIKPKVIHDILESTSEDLVFLDADSTVEKYPSIFDEIPLEYDIGYHELEWKSWYGYSNSNEKELLSGTLFLRNNNKVKALCREWYKRAMNQNKWEQKVLQELLELDVFKINAFKLPIEYCYIKSRPRNQEPLVKADPVILHHQVSRLYKGTL